MVGTEKWSPSMSDFLRELEEDIREEKIFILWRKYGNYIIGVALAIVIGTTGYTLWKHWKKQAQLQGHLSFSQAVNLAKQGKKDEAVKAFQVISKEGGGYGKLAQLYEASLLSNPAALYDQVAKENRSDPALGNLPKVLMAFHDVSSAEALKSIEPLSGPNNAWAPLSLEILAFADLKQGEPMKAAEKYIRILKERYANANEKTRASLMLSQIDIPASLLGEEPKKED